MHKAKLPSRVLVGTLLALALATAGGCAAEADDVGGSAAYQTAGDPRIHASAGFVAASAADRAKIDRIALDATPETKANLADVLEKDAQRLFDTDKDGQTTLDNLVSLFASDAHPKIAALSSGFTALAIRSAVLADVAHPENIHQGPFNTCQITCLQFALANAYPSEYVRLMRGLVGTTGKVRMRKGGELVLYTGYLVPKSNDSRSASEAIFQTSVMDEVTGSYDPQSDRSKLLFISYPGNSTRMAEGTFEQLFDVQYDVRGQSDLQVVMNPLSTMKKDDAVRFLNDLRIQRAPAIVDAVLEGVGTSHSLVVTKIEGGRVFFRNPWGPQRISQRSGRVEDAKLALYSMTVDELAGIMQTHIAPR
jgi:hypothetical protein